MSVPGIVQARDATSQVTQHKITNFTLQAASE